MKDNGPMNAERAIRAGLCAGLRAGIRAGLCAGILGALSLASCASIRRSALRAAADMLSSPEGAGTFTSDDDPRLVADALPLALKLYEVLLEQDPENAALAGATGRNYVMYSGAFVQMPAEMLADEEWERADRERKRAGRLFRRGRDYLLRALELEHEGFMDALDSGDYDGATSMLTRSDASTAYWAALGWLATAAADPFNMETAASLDKAVLLLYRALELDDSDPGVHDAMIQVQLSLPSAVTATMRERAPATAAFMDGYYAAAGAGGEARGRALFHYRRAVTLADGANAAGPNLTMASALAVKEQDVPAFREYLDRALAVDADAYPETRLMTIIHQNRARWMLENMENFFLVDF